MKFIFDNPEIKRNIWVKLHPLKLFLLPTILFVVYSLFSRGYWPPVITEFTTPLFVIFVLFAGAYQCAISFQSEYAHKTYDLLRMSSISPLELMFGKVFGSAITSWYISIFLLGSFFFAMQHHEGVLREDYLFLVACLLLVTVSLHCLAFTFGVDLSGNPNASKQSSHGGFIVLICGFIAMQIHKLMQIPFPLSAYDGFKIKQITWYGMEFAAQPFLLCLFAIAAIWCIVAAYRCCMHILFYQKTPLAWVLFVSSVAILVCGYDSHTAMPPGFLKPDMKMEPLLHQSPGYYKTLLGICVALILFYYLQLYFSTERNIKSRQRGGWQGFFLGMPLWVATTLMFIIFYSYLYVRDPGPDLQHFKLMTGLAALFALRDGVFMRIVAGTRTRSFNLFAYFATVYFLAPFLFMLTVKKHALDYSWIFYPLQLHGSVPYGMAAALLLMEIFILGVIYYLTSETRRSTHNPFAKGSMTDAS